MANATLALQRFLGRDSLQQLAGPVLILLILSMMVLPLPAFMLDLFFTFNIAVSVIVMLVAINVMKPLDFSVFPTVLLITTLLRLSLNVASTRIVLLEGHTGPGAAGQVIEAFGHFLVGGNYAVGIVVFAILVIINFVVITKGAGRVAEVAARFTLDAMPGKQMAIDADLNAGLIGEDEARKRRATIADEANFFGSMDGASKFVRGDAVAGILIMLINVLGGLFVGVLQHNLDVGAAAKTYTLLAIGDGLVAQIPALIISIAAGMVVTRVGDTQDISQQFLSQLFNNPRVVGLTAAIIGLLGLIPGMPNFVFLLLAVCLGTLAWDMDRRTRTAKPIPVAPAPVRLTNEVQEASWADVAAARRARPGSRLSADSAGRQSAGRRAAAPHPRHSQEIRPGSRLPGFAGAYSRQPGTQTQRLPHPAQGRRDRPGRRPSRAVYWRSTRGVSPASCRAPRLRIRRSACRRCGSTAPCASRRRLTAIPWSTPARWPRRTSIT